MARRELVAEGTLEVSYQRGGLACLGHDAGGACGGGVTDYGVLGGGEDLGGLGLGGGWGPGGSVGTRDVVCNDCVLSRSGLGRHIGVEPGIVYAADLVLREFVEVGLGQVGRGSRRRRGGGSGLGFLLQSVGQDARL